MSIADIMHGPVVLRRAPVGTPVPADTVALGGDWPAGWSSFGFTAAPLTAKYEFETDKIEVEEQMAPLLEWKTTESLVLATELAELTPANLAVVTSGTATHTDQAVGQPEKDELFVGGDNSLDVFAWGFEGTYNASNGSKYPIRLFVWRGQAKMSGEQEHGKKGYAKLPIEVTALVDDSKPIGGQLYKFQRILGEAL